jgi:hypothetical protein
MGTEALVLRGSDVRVRLHRMTELGREPLTELQDGRPHAVQRLQYQRRAVGEEPDELVIADLIGDSRADATLSSKGLVSESCAVLGDAQEWGSQTSLGYQLIDCVRTEQFAESAREIGSWGQQWLLSPVLISKLIAINGDELSED